MLYNQISKTQLPGCSECDHCCDSFFCNLDIDVLDSLSINKSSSTYKKGQVIFHEGNRPHGLYCIYEGKVKIYKLGNRGKEQIIRLAGNGEILGYRSLVCNERYYGTATVLEDSKICHISLESFKKVLESSSDLNYKLMKLLTKDIKESEKKIINISQKSVEERVAEALILLKECFGMEENGTILNTSITRKEIGDISGVTTESTIRKLSDLNKQGVINLRGRKIEILDMNRLIRVANLQD